MTTVLLTLLFFGLCMTGMAIGLLVQSKSLRGSCGGNEVHDSDGDAISCGACPKKEQEVCPSDDRYVGLAQISYPGPRHH